MKLVSLVLCAALAMGCIPLNTLRGDESRHRSTKEEDAVDLALLFCFKELAARDDDNYVNGPISAVDNVRRAIKNIEDAQAIASADRSIADRTWPFPWNNKQRYAPIGVVPGLARCRTELPDLMARWQALADRDKRQDDANEKLADEDLKQAIATVGPQRRSVLRLHGLPREYKHGAEWQRESHWHYGHEAGDTQNGFYICQISYFFEDEKLVASNETPRNCANIVRP